MPKTKREKVNLPKSAQQTIPVRTLYDDGIFYLGNDEYSKTFAFSDLNYILADDDERTQILTSYAEVLNSFDVDTRVKITVNHHKLNRKDFEEKAFLKLRGDKQDKYRRILNDYLSDKMNESGFLISDRYLTITVTKKSVDEARGYFSRKESELSVMFSRFGVQLDILSVESRLKIMHDFYLSDEDRFSFDISRARKFGFDFKDAICPDSIEVNKDYLVVGKKYARVLFVRKYPAWLKDTFLSDLTELEQNIMISIDIMPVSPDKAVRKVNNILLGVEKNITDWQRRQNNNRNFSAQVPYQMDLQRNTVKEFLDEINQNDGKMMYALATLVHTADSKEQLDRDTEAILSTANSRVTQMSTLTFQQLDGLNTVLPYGKKNISAKRTFVSNSLVALCPFNVCEVQHTNGIDFGQNAVSKNMLFVDKMQLKNGNSLILGVPGSGKSFTAKMDMVKSYLRYDDVDIMVIDPQGEYVGLTKALGGEVVDVSASGDTYINAMEINEAYNAGSNPVALKSDFLSSVLELLFENSSFTTRHRSIIDRCAGQIYRPYIASGYKGNPPTLEDFRQLLSQQPEEEGKQMAVAMEMYSSGSFSIFSKQTNVDINNRFVCFNVVELGTNLKSFGMLVVLDNVMNRISANRNKKRRTFIYIDELSVFFQHRFSAEYLYMLWKIVRKYGALMTGIDQNVEDLLQNATARSMLSNSEFVVMLNQAASDREQLAKLYSLSNQQLKYLESAGEGQGILKVGTSGFVPFTNRFPKDNELYSLITTKFGES